MHRKNLLAVIVCAFAAVCASTARAEQVENPAYKAWANYKVGTSVSMKGTNEMAGQSMEMSNVTTLTEVADDHVTIEVQTTVVAMGQTQNPPKQKVELKKMVDKADMSQPGKGFDPDLLKNAKDEKVTVAAGTFNAKLIEMTKQQGPMTMKIKSWFSDEVPGGSVKSEINGEGQTAMHMTMELVSIDKK